MIDTDEMIPGTGLPAEVHQWMTAMGIHTDQVPVKDIQMIDRVPDRDTQMIDRDLDKDTQRIATTDPGPDKDIQMTPGTNGLVRDRDIQMIQGTGTGMIFTEIDMVDPHHVKDILVSKYSRLRFSGKVKSFNSFILVFLMCYFNVL